MASRGFSGVQKLLMASCVVIVILFVTLTVVTVNCYRLYDTENITQATYIAWASDPEVVFNDTDVSNETDLVIKPEKVTDSPQVVKVYLPMDPSLWYPLNDTTYNLDKTTLARRETVKQVTIPVFMLDTIVI